jgi:centrosomal protein CEP350
LNLLFAVPHKSDAVGAIVASAVDVYWTRRRYGEALDGVEPPETYFSQEDAGSDLESNSKRVYKKLLFDLTGQIIRDMLAEEEEPEPAPWQKPKRKHSKLLRGRQLPPTLDVIKPLVQEAVIDILGLNGSRKAGVKNKWGIRKKKDHVDNILVQELREEEPQWVNYDDDELAVKLQLTDTIFDSLLNDTVQTMNKIFRKRHSLGAQHPT